MCGACADMQMPCLLPSVHLSINAEGAAFQDFVRLSQRAFNILRANANLLITLFSLMQSCGIPELTKPEDIDWLREHLMVRALCCCDQAPAPPTGVCVCVSA